MAETTTSSTYTEAHKRYYEKHKAKIRSRNRTEKAKQNRRYYDLHRLDILAQQRERRKQQLRDTIYSQVLPAKADS